jgi:hypothetical protein
VVSVVLVAALVLLLPIAVATPAMGPSSTAPRQPAAFVTRAATDLLTSTYRSLVARRAIPIVGTPGSDLFVTIVYERTRSYTITFHHAGRHWTAKENRARKDSFSMMESGPKTLDAARTHALFAGADLRR